MDPKPTPQVNSNYRRLRSRLHLEDDSTSLSPTQQWDRLANYLVFILKKIRSMVVDQDLNVLYGTVIATIVDTVSCECLLHQKMTLIAGLDKDLTQGPIHRSILLKSRDHVESGAKIELSLAEQQLELLQLTIVELTHFTCKRPRSVFDLYVSLIRRYG